MTYDMNDGRFVRRLSTPCSVGDAGDVVEHVQMHIFPGVEEYLQEELWALLINSRKQVTHDVLVSRGLVDGTFAHPTIVFREAIRLGAAHVIVVHNHPSGDPAPSHADVLATQRLRSAGKLIGISLLDHVIVAKDASYSFAQHEWRKDTT